MKAPAVSFMAVSGTPVDILAQVKEDRKQRVSTLTLAFLNVGTAEPAGNAQTEAAVRNLGVKLNKAVVQRQIDSWKKQLAKASGKAEDAVKEHEKAQAQQAKTQAKLEKSARLKSKLQDEHAVLQREIDLYNQKWTLSQDQKDLKKLTKARTKITDNETEMAKAMQAEAETQKSLVKNADELPDAQKEREQKTAAQADVQRTVDALQRKMENIR
jgi:chromosome segregation ATPase